MKVMSGDFLGGKNIYNTNFYLGFYIWGRGRSQRYLGERLPQTESLAFVLGWTLRKPIVSVPSSQGRQAGYQWDGCCSSSSSSRDWTWTQDVEGGGLSHPRNLLLVPREGFWWVVWGPRGRLQGFPRVCPWGEEVLRLPQSDPLPPAVPHLRLVEQGGLLDHLRQLHRECKSSQDSGNMSGRGYALTFTCIDTVEWHGVIGLLSLGVQCTLCTDQVAYVLRLYQVVSRSQQFPMLPEGHHLIHSL